MNNAVRKPLKGATPEGIRRIVAEAKGKGDKYLCRVDGRDQSESWRQHVLEYTLEKE